MGAPIWNVIFEEGSDFDLVLKYQNGCDAIDVSAYGARFAVRNTPDEDALVVGSVTGGQIVITGVSGLFTLKIGAATIDGLQNTLIPSEAQYAFIIWPGASTPDVNPKRLLQGCVDYSRDFGGP